MGYRQNSDTALVVVDTPGVLDTNRSAEEIRTEITRSLELTEPGPHAFLLVLRFSRLTDEEKNVVTWLQSIFGSKMMEHTIVVFTGMDNLVADEGSVGEFINTADTELTQLLELCQKRYVTINNRDSLEEKSKTVRKLLGIIEKMVESHGGRHFSA
jgi:GTPase Era involved in 16S rRNA processing